MSENENNDNGNFENLPGPNRFYRTERISLKKIKNLDIRLEVSGPKGPLTDGRPQDLSSTGLMVTFPGPVKVQKNDRVELGLWINTFLVYKGNAVIKRIDQNKEKTDVAFVFSDGLINPANVMKAAKMISGIGPVVDEIFNWKPEYEETGDVRQYMVLLTEFRAFLVNTRQKLTAFEEKIGKMELDTPGFKEMFEPIAQRLMPIFEEYLKGLDRIRRNFDTNTDKAMKSLTQRVLYDLILEAQVFKRCVDQPRGYPGDYQIMTYLYKDWWEGDNLFAKYMHYNGCVIPGARAVLLRKNIVKDILLKKIGLLTSEDRFRFLSIAAGPAQETYELLPEIDDSMPMIDIVLYEQDEEALNFSYNRIMSRVREFNLADRVNVIFLHDAVKNLIKKPAKDNVLSRVGSFDVIFASGLFDYLKTKSAKALISTFYRILNPGGKMAIGNMDGWHPNRWIMEYLLRWTLLYRTKDELYHLGDDLEGNPEQSVTSEENGINNFLIIDKPILKSNGS